MPHAQRSFESEALERLARIEERLSDLPTRVADLERHKTKAEAFIAGAKWMAVVAIGLISAGFLKLGLGDAIANASDFAQHK
jgi:hypothetical protein